MATSFRATAAASLAAITLLVGTGQVAAQAPGTMDAFDANIVGEPFNSHVMATSVQPDGKTIIAGKFDAVLGVPRKHIARLHTDGSLDTVFDPNVNDYVICVAVQADGRILLGGNFTALQPNGTPSSTQYSYIARLNASGSLDASFDLRANGAVHSLAVQPDGKILLGGAFTMLQPGGAATATIRKGIARVTADGNLDTGFDPNPDNNVNCLALLTDGKILLGGGFTALQPNGAVNPTPRSRIARLNTDGSVDTGFDLTADRDVDCLAVQTDGKYLLGGRFNTLQPKGAASPISRRKIARVNFDGSLDMGFDPRANGFVLSMALQADGKILAGGEFMTLQPNGSVNPIARNNIARLNGDGSVDPVFDPNANAFLWGVAVRADGKILLSGRFTTLQPNGTMSPTARNYLARLNSNAASSILSTPDPTRVLWQRAGASPEVSQVTFEQSSDGGTNWTSLGNGTRVGTTASWERTGLMLPASGKLRARGRTTNGPGNGSSGLVEAVVSFPPTPMQAWNQIWFGQTGGTGAETPGADPNRNGIPNLMEYALGGDPAGQTTGTSILPQAMLSLLTERMEFRFTRYPDRNDITLTIQAANDPAGPWETIARSANGDPFTILSAAYEGAETGTGTSRAVTISGILPVDGPRHFMRLHAAMP